MEIDVYIQKNGRIISSDDIYEVVCKCRPGFDQALYVTILRTIRKYSQFTDDYDLAKATVYDMNPLVQLRHVKPVIEEDNAPNKGTAFGSTICQGNTNAGDAGTSNTNAGDAGTSNTNAGDAGTSNMSDA